MTAMTAHAETNIAGNCFHHGAYAGPIGRHGLAVCPTCQAAEDAQLVDERMAASGLRGRFRDCSFDNFLCTHPNQAKAVATCREFIANVKPNVWGGPWLIGPPGTGKTHLGAATAIYSIRQRRAAAAVMSAREIVRRLRATWRKDSPETEDQVIDHLGGVPLLVLDEVGVGSGTDAEMTQLFDIVNRRYELQRPVLLLSNLPVSDLRGALGDRAFDRLREGAKVLVCDWPSYRAGARS
jgi:DNA replication protein DnaC